MSGRRGWKVAALVVVVWARLGQALPAAAEDPRVLAVRSLIADGRYDEAETRASALSGPSAPALEGQADGQELYVDALIRNGRGGEPRTLALARALPATASGRRLLGEALLESGFYRDAAVELSRAVRLEEQVAGATGAGLAESLDSLARALLWLERRDDALRAAERAVALCEQQAPASAALAGALATRGFVRQRRAEYASARADLEHARQIRASLAERHPETARILTLLGDELRIDGHLPEARETLESALAIAEATLRSGHPDIAETLQKLAIPVTELGEFDRAMRLVERSLSIDEGAYGPNHPLVGIQLNDLADSYSKRGDYGEARRAQQRALTIYERRLGADHSYVATAVFNLALINEDVGDFAEAARLHRRALRTWERTVGPGHPYTAWALMGLGDALANQGRHQDAIPLYERSLAIRKGALNPDHDQVAEVLTKLSRSLAATNRMTRAAAVSGEALQLWERSKNPEGLSDALLSRARIDMARGDYEAARIGFQRTIDVRVPLFGADHPGVGDARAGLAEAWLASGRRDQALEAALAAERIGRDHLRLTTSSLPERQALNYAAARPHGLDTALATLANGGSGTPTLDALVRSRALVLDEIAARQHILEGAAGEAVAPLLARLNLARQRLANLAVRGPEGLPAAQYASLIDGARREKEAAESTLAERSAVVRRELARKEVGLEDVGAALPARTAMVSFVRYERSTFPAAGATDPAARIQKAPAYLAFVLRADTAEPAVVDLGAARSLDAAIARWRRELANGITPEGAVTPGGERALRTAGLSLRKQLWDPVAGHLAQVDQVFVVPDGALNLLPLAALPSDATRYLVETGPTIHYLSAERDLVVRETPGRAAKGLLAVGGPAYGNTGGQAAPAIATTAQRSVCGTLETIMFPVLPASRDEAEDVTAAWRRAGAAAGGQAEPTLILTGASATEAAFKRSSPGRRILHLATHGFFLDPKCAAAGASGPGRTPATPPAALFPENPLLQSGLALARANYRSAPDRKGEDGILMAEEVAGLDLDGVEWAVLSACDTGLGEIKAGEGVLGLRRAFQIAGARTIVMSLWAVEDQAGRAWMRALYEGRLGAHQSTADAVRNASLTVLRQRRADGVSTHPFFWAGFVAAGDWR